MIPYELGEKVVWVYHGQVVYADDPASVVESYLDRETRRDCPFRQAVSIRRPEGVPLHRIDYRQAEEAGAVSARF